MTRNGNKPLIYAVNNKSNLLQKALFVDHFPLLFRFNCYKFPATMNSKLLLLALAFAGGLVFPSRLSAQTPAVNFPAASPACTLKQRVGLTDIEIVYSRPGVKDRTIFGGIVPYGQVWRTGANQATKITFSTPVKLEGIDIPAGTYALFTIPGETEWTIIINKNAAQLGAFQYNQKDDLVRFKVTPVTLAESIETFTIEFNHIRDESAVLNLVWDKTVVPIHLEVDVAGKLVPQIEAAMASPDKKAGRFLFSGRHILLQPRPGPEEGPRLGQRRAGGQSPDCLRDAAFEGADSGKAGGQGGRDCRRQTIHRTGHQGRRPQQFIREDEPGFDFEPATMTISPPTKIQH